jgi:hypothetical protein
MALDEAGIDESRERHLNACVGRASFIAQQCRRWNDAVDLRV